MKNLTKILSLVLAIFIIVPGVLAASTTLNCAGNDYNVNSAQTGNNFTVDLMDMTGNLDEPDFIPPNYFYFGTRDGNEYEDVNVHSPSGLILLDANYFRIADSNRTLNSYTFNFTATPGSYDVNFVLTDINGVFPQCLITHTLAHNAVINLNLSSVSDQNLGQAFVLDANLTNVGLTSANQVTVSLSPNNSVNYDANVLSYSSFSLSAGTEVHNTFLLTPLTCGSTSTGVQVSYKNINGISLPQLSSTRDFNIRGANINTISLTADNSNPLDGNIVRLTATIKNTGDLNISSAFDLNFFYGTVLIDKNSVSGLDANQTKTISMDFNTSGKSGTHTLKVVSDQTSAITECSEIDNNSTVQLTVQPLYPGGYDINSVSFTLSASSVQTATDVNLVAVIKTDTVSLSNVVVVFKDGSTVLNTQTVNLVAGQELTLSTLQQFATAGTHDLNVFIDPDNLFNESNEPNNSRIASLTVTLPPAIVETPAPSTTPSDTSGGGPGSGPSTPAETEVDATPTEEDLTSTLAELNLQDYENSAKELLTKVELSRNLDVKKAFTNSGTEYKSTVTLTFKNTSTEILKNIKIVEVIPKSVALTASLLKSNLEFVVLEDDPVIQFTLTEVHPGEEFELSYYLEQEVTDSAFDEFGNALVLGEKTEIVPIEAEIIPEEEPVLVQEETIDDSHGVIAVQSELTAVTPTGFLGLGGLENNAALVLGVLVLLALGYQFGLKPRLVRKPTIVPKKPVKWKK